MSYNSFEVIILTNNRGLKNRKTISNAIRTDLHDKLKDLSEETKIPMSRLLDEAIEYLLENRSKD